MVTGSYQGEFASQVGTTGDQLAESLPGTPTDRHELARGAAHAVYCPTDSHSSCRPVQREEARGKIFGTCCFPPGLCRYSVCIQHSQRLADPRFIQVGLLKPLPSHNSSLVSEGVDVRTAPLLFDGRPYKLHRVRAKHQSSLASAVDHESLSMGAVRLALEGPPPPPALPKYCSPKTQKTPRFEGFRGGCLVHCHFLVLLFHGFCRKPDTAP